MSQYAGRHRGAPAPRSRGRVHPHVGSFAPRLLGAASATVVLVGGSVAYSAVAAQGESTQALAAAGSVDEVGAAQVDALTLTSLDTPLADAATAADQREHRLASHLAASAQADGAKKAADAATAAAAADAAAAQAQRQADAERAARDAQRAADLANAQQNPKAAAQAMLSDFGFADSQFSCLDKLWTRESGWKYTATNRSSGAYGIPQSLPASKMATVGADYRTNPVTQITWGLQYIKAIYGTPCGAWAHSQATGWY